MTRRRRPVGVDSARRRSALVSSHSGESANRLMARSVLLTPIRSMDDRTFRSGAKEYPSGGPGADDTRMTNVRTPGAVAAGPRASYRSVFAVGEFRVIFAGLLMFGLGFEFEILGLSVLVYARTGSGLLAAVAFSAGFAPQAVAGAFFTSLADRLPARAVISGGLLARAVPGLVIGFAPAMPVPVTLTVVAAAALVTPVFLAGNSGLLPEILDGDRYTLGRSLFSMVSSGGQIAALGLGGALLSVLPAHWLLIFAGLLLAASAVVSGLGLPSHPGRAGADRSAAAGRAGGMGGGARGTVRATLA